MGARRRALVLRVLLLALLLVLSSSRRASARNENRYRTIVERASLEERLEFLSPRNIIANRWDGGWRAESETAASLNTTCARDTYALLQGILMRRIWALKMLDASSKIPSGIMEGNVVDLGMYDECVSARGTYSHGEIRGRPCMYSMRLTRDNESMPLRPTLSICLPSACTADDLAKLLGGVNVVSKMKIFGIELDSAYCTPDDVPVWDTKFVVAFTCLASLIVFLVGCTLCDLVISRLCAGETRHPSLHALSRFSVLRSAASILSTSPKEDSLPAIHGVRALSIAWIVLGHQYFSRMAGVNVNNVDIAEWIRSWRSTYIFTAPFAVDTFFALSGFLMTYLFLMRQNKGGKFNVPMYYIHRYLRLTPPVAAILVIAYIFVPKLGSGARWNFIMNEGILKCPNNWWTTLLYIRNLVDREEQFCMGYLWYLSVDMQLFWISPMILYPLYKWPKIGLAITAVLLLASIAIPATITAVYKYPFNFFLHTDLEAFKGYFMNIYAMPYNRAGPWLVGILFAFDVVGKKRVLNKLNISIGWLLAFGGLVFCTLGLRKSSNSDEVNLAWEVFFESTSRPIWALSVCLIIYLSIYNYSGLIGSILSHKLFMPLSRLSYCLYLVHMVVQSIQVGALRVPLYFSDNSVWLDYLGTLAVSLVAAFVISILFESPVIVLEKLLISWASKSRSKSHEALIKDTDDTEEK